MIICNVANLGLRHDVRFDVSPVLTRDVDE